MGLNSNGNSVINAGGGVEWGGGAVAGEEYGAFSGAIARYNR